MKKSPRANSFLLFVFLITVYLSVAQAQEVQVVEQTTHEGVAAATIFNLRSGFSTVTDDEGIASISNSHRSDTLIIQHLSFHPVTTTLAQILDNNARIMLVERMLSVEEVVISASKWEENRRELPRQMSTISSRDIAFVNAQTAADMLAGMGEVFVQKSQGGGGSPILRGFEANKVLLVIDGVRMNNAIYRSGHLQNVISLDAASLESAEVLFGPGSVIYGSDALGGVMDFHTRRARVSRDGTQMSGHAYARYASANFEKSVHADVNLGLSRFASLSSITFSDYDDLRTGSLRDGAYPEWGKRKEYVETNNGSDIVRENDDPNLQKITGYSQVNFLQKLRWQPDPLVGVEYAFHYSTSSDVPRYDRLTEYSSDSENSGSLLKYADWHYGPQNWMMNSMSLSYGKPTPVSNHLRLIVARQDIDEDRITRKLNEFGERHREEDVSVWSVNLDACTPIGPTDCKLFWGAEAVFNDVLSSAYEYDVHSGLRAPASTRYPDGGSDMNTFAAYVTWKTALSETWKLSAGLRYSHIYLESRFVDTTFYTFPFDRLEINTGALNGSLGFVFLPTQQWKLYVNLSSGFRAPNVDDAGKIFDSSPGSVMVPNADLGAEFAYSTEAGINTTIGRSVNLSINGFYTRLTDAIVRADYNFNGQDSIMYDGTLSRVQANVNAGEASIYGGSATVLAELSGMFSIGSSLTWTRGWNVAAATPLGHIPPLFGDTRFIFSRDRFKGELLLRYSAWKRIADFSPTGEDNDEQATADGTPPWWTLNLRFSWQLSESFQLNAGMENILDVHYRPFSSGVSAAGRNLFLTLRTAF